MDQETSDCSMCFLCIKSPFLGSVFSNLRQKMMLLQVTWGDGEFRQIIYQGIGYIATHLRNEHTFYEGEARKVGGSSCRSILQT